MRHNHTDHSPHHHSPHRGGGRGGWDGRGRHSGRGRRAGRGDIRAAVITLLAESPMHGYQIIQELETRSNGLWRPSPGSIYPTLQQLEDEGLVQADASEGKRTYSLTGDGRTYVTEHADEVSAPWQGMPAGETHDDGLKPLIGQIAAAIWQIASVGTPEQQARGREALIELRRKLHLILAEPDQSTDESTDEAR
jgi:DNA-binding PadR family transcriptional regulator